MTLFYSFIKNYITSASKILREAFYHHYLHTSHIVFVLKKKEPKSFKATKGISLTNNQGLHNSKWSWSELSRSKHKALDLFQVFPKESLLKGILNKVKNKDTPVNNATVSTLS